MDIVCSPAGFVNPNMPGQGIMDLANAGFENVFLELGMCCGAWELEGVGQPLKKGEPAPDIKLVTEDPAEMGGRFERMVSLCREKGIRILSARSPYLYRDTKRTDLTDLLIRIQKESIWYCGRIGCKYLVIRPLFAGVSRQDEWSVNRDYYLQLGALAKENQVMILLENQCRDMNGHLIRGICSDGSEAAEWVDRLNEELGWECFGFCMDVGVCSLCGQDMYEFAQALKDRIKMVIVRDCDGYHETSMLPFTSVGNGQPQTDWLGLIRGLRKVGFDGQLVMDFAGTAGAFSPLLRPQLMTLAKAVAEYFQWQIEIEGLLKRYRSIVLFGAGNMCRNYMKCYGETYPPLFTCDNNERLWGTNFCGLEVKPPKALKELSEDCMVLICNIYYREIEKQLRDMGVKNIGFFNDEYMPSFHFDRLREV